MTINHNAIRATLKWLTIGIFLVALGHKLYQIYKYGGKVPTEPTDTNEIDDVEYTDDEYDSPTQALSYND